MSTMEIRVPDIGPAPMDVIEVKMSPGAEVAEGDALLVLESDKAATDMPSPASGKLVEVRIKVGDRVVTDQIVAVLETAGAGAAAGSAAGAAAGGSSGEAANANSNAAPAADATADDTAAKGGEDWVEVIPDIGNFADVPVIEVSVKVGDRIEPNATLVVLESDKATMDVPAVRGGVVKELFLKVDDKVKMGTPILRLALDAGAGAAPSPDKTGEADASSSKPQIQATDKSGARTALSAMTTERGVAARPVAGGGVHEERKAVYGRTPGFEGDGDKAHAGPATRKLARELGVNLAHVKGTGKRGRIVADDVKAHVKSLMTDPGFPASPGSGSAGAPGQLDLAPWPSVDFAQFGPVERAPLSRIKKLSGRYLARNWVMIPHVTQCEDADMTELERFRKTLNKEWAAEGVKASPLVFIIKAAVAALKAYPEVNSSLDGEDLVLKRYYHIGFAADTAQGLVVPVLKDADRKGLKEIAIELGELSAKARAGKLTAAEMQGASFTISSLGGIGGTYFTPIVNAPEAAILGVCRSEMRPKWNGQGFEPRLMTPLSFSYDHRIIDGALACRFVTYLKSALEDFRRTMI